MTQKTSLIMPDSIVTASTQIPSEVYELVERFERFKYDYKSSTYKEIQLRNEFINPFWHALGWDMDNSRNKLPAHLKEVVYDDRLRDQGRVTAPDYTFRLNGERKFFLEVKAPKVYVKEDMPPAYQLRRYGWSAGLQVSILSDFEEFAVYRCDSQPSLKEKASHDRIEYFTYRDYAEKWPFIWSVFSRPAQEAGGFQAFVDQRRPKRGSQLFDRAFLSSMLEWRKELATNIASLNRTLDEAELNAAVQATLDRLVFLRIAEDRGVEDYGNLALAAGFKIESDGSIKTQKSLEGIYHNLLSLFKQADDRYNSGLFHFKKEKYRNHPDTLTPNLKVDDKVLRSIISDLYYPESPYAFETVPSDILGNVYEKFLSHRVTLTSRHTATIEEKPEIRRAGGVYYTPTFVVKYIVRRALDQKFLGKTPEAVKEIAVLDCSCGSGSFLLEAYDYLLRWYLEYYLGNNPASYLRRGVLTETQKTGPRPEYALSVDERKKILLRHIYGVDIDHQAVEVARLNLLLKVLEGTEDEAVKSTYRTAYDRNERLLPDLEANVVCGNSLLSRDMLGASKLNRELIEDMKPLDWETTFSTTMQRGGFDVIIGNPPYARVQVLQEFHAKQVPYLKQNYATAAGSFDVYALFIERSLSLLNSKGVLGYIVPHKFFPAQFAEPLRELITTKQALQRVVHFGHNLVFEDADTFTCLLFLSKQRNKDFALTEFVGTCDLRNLLHKDLSNELGETLEYRAGSLLAPKPSSAKWAFKVGLTGALLERLVRHPFKLGSITDKLFVGLQTSLDEVYVLSGLSKRKKGVLTLHSEALGKEVEIEAGLVKPFMLGRDLSRYRQPTSDRFVIFPYELINGSAVLMEEGRLKKEYPLGYDYLKANKRALEGREKGKMRGKGWFGYIYPKNLAYFEQPKILMRELGDRPNFSMDNEGKFYHTTKIYSITTRSLGYSSYTLLAILNSKVCGFFIANTSEIWGKSFKFKTQFMEPFPIPEVIPAEVGNDLHEFALELERLRSQNSVDLSEQERRHVDYLEYKINHLVYSLYDLTRAEQDLIESAMSY